jgi:hypothetical protein
MRIHSIIKLKKIGFTLGSILLVLGCQYEDKDLKEPNFSKTAEIFTDTPVGMGSDFYFPYGPDANNPPGSKFTAWTVDQKVSYQGNASMRFDVPNANDPEGNYAGAIFRVDGAGRDLTGYDALTFWAKASQGVTIGEFGFGEDFYPNKYITTLTNVSLGTAWAKYIIPIPDASKLINEKGMFRYSAGGVGELGKEVGYTFWIDELKFEKLGTIAQPQPKILNGIDVIQQTFIGATITIDKLTDTFKMPSGSNQTVSVSPSYFTFISSNTGVATVNELGEVSVIGIGNATVTASLNNVVATGSLKINAGSAFVNATNPTLPQSNVISLFSDAYSGVTGFNPGFFAGGNDAVNISEKNFANNKHLNYQSIGYVGLGWTGTVNASTKTMIHLDIQLKNAAASNLILELKDFGPDNIDNNFVAGKDSAGGYNLSNQLVQDKWVSLDIPLNAFTLRTGGGGSGLLNRNNIGFVIFVSNNGASFLVDNIYFY